MAKTVKVLDMVFKAVHENKKYHVRLVNPKEDLKKETVEAAMQFMAEKEIYLFADSQYIPDSAAIVVTSTDALYKNDAKKPNQVTM